MRKPKFTYIVRVVRLHDGFNEVTETHKFKDYEKAKECAKFYNELYKAKELPFRAYVEL